MFGPMRWEGNTAVPVITLRIDLIHFKAGSRSGQTPVSDVTALIRIDFFSFFLSFVGVISSNNLFYAMLS